MAVNYKVRCPKCDMYSKVRCNQTKYLSKGSIKRYYFCLRCKKYFSGQTYKSFLDLSIAIKNQTEKATTGYLK